jgi:hypothetical protein
LEDGATDADVVNWSDTTAGEVKTGAAATV